MEIFQIMVFSVVILCRWIPLFRRDVPQCGELIGLYSQAVRKVVSQFQGKGEGIKCSWG
jgi:hypothetical protein